MKMCAERQWIWGRSLGTQNSRNPAMKYNSVERWSKEVMKLCSCGTSNPLEAQELPKDRLEREYEKNKGMHLKNDIVNLN